MSFSKTELLAYMRKHRLAVVSSIAASGQPQSALVGIAITDRHEIVFDTVSDSRKHANLTRDDRASLVFSGPDEQTLQFKGIARPISVTADEGEELREAYYAVGPDGRGRLAWAKIAYWCVIPKWARYSDFAKGPLIQEFRWP